MELDIRGRIVIAEALALASAWLLRAGLPLDEPSNRRDMDVLLNNMFADFASAAREKAEQKLATVTKL